MGRTAMLDLLDLLGDRPLDRRTLLRLALGAGALAWGARPNARAAARRVRVVLVGGHDAALADALAFGVDEAARSARPFGVAVALERAADARAVSAARDAALVLFGGDDDDACRTTAARARALGAVYVDAWCGLDAWAHRADGCARSVVHVAPSGAMRVDALATGAPAALNARRWLVTTADASDAQMLLAVRGARALGAAGATVVGMVGQTRVDGGAHDAVLHVGPTIEARRGDDARPLHALGWHASLEAFGGTQLGDRYRLAVHRPMDERGWAAWAGVKLVVEAALRAAPGESIAQRLARADFIFDAHKGAPLFVRTDDRQLVQPLYLVRVAEGGAGEVLSTVPRVGGADPRARLAALGREPHACGSGA